MNKYKVLEIEKNVIEWKPTMAKFSSYSISVEEIWHFATYISLNFSEKPTQVSRDFEGKQKS